MKVSGLKDREEAGSVIIESTERELPDELDSITLQPTFIAAYVSPHLDIDQIGAILEDRFPGVVKSVCSTAGELHTLTDQLYCETGNYWDRVVVHCFDSSIIDRAEQFVIPLDCEDLRQGKIEIDLEERILRLKERIKNLQVEMEIDYRDTFVYTLFDGVSKSESFFLEALYDSGRFPCLFVGGSVGGTLDFTNTWLHDGKTIYQNHVFLVFLKMAPNIRFGVMKSQNFFVEGSVSFSILAASVEHRYVTQVIDNQGHMKSFIAALCETFNCVPEEIEEKLSDYSFAIRVGKELFVRSIAKVDVEMDVVHFYCDIFPGEELFLVKRGNLAESTGRHFQRFLEDKPSPPITGILNDCILRRLLNVRQPEINKVFANLAVAGFSTFGEILGISLNQTLTAIFFFRQQEGVSFKDEYVDNFPIMYSEFKAFFLKRRLAKQEGLTRIVANQIKDFKKGIYEKKLNPTGMGAAIGSVFEGLNDLGSALNEAKEQSFLEADQIEMRLRESEERFRILSESSLTGIYLIQKGRFSYVNAAFARMFGYEIAEIVDEQIPLLDLVAPEHRQMVAENVRRRVTGEDLSIRYSFRGLRKNGSTFYLEVHGKRIFYQGDVGVIGTFIDITEQKKAEAALRASEANYRILYNETPSMFFTVDRKGRISAVNDFASNQLGFVKEELLGTSFVDLFHADDKEKVQRDLATCLDQDGGIITWQYRKRQKKSDFIWCEGFARAVSDLEGEDELLIVSNDISERKRLEESLKISQYIFENASIAIFLVKDDSIIVDVNECACRSLGYTKEELCGLSIFGIDPEIKTEQLNQLKESLLTTHSATLKTTHRRKNGETFPVQVFISSLPNVGTPLRVYFVKDISDMELARLEQEKLKTQLEQVQKLEAIGRLAGGIAHDLNNLLTPILGYSGLLVNDSSIGERAQAKLSQISKAAVGARELVRQLLAFSRKQVLEYRMLDLGELVNDFSKLLRRTIRENIELSITQSSDLKPIVADQGQIEQVLMNLAVNASDAMPDGGKLSIETKLLELDETYTRFHPETTEGKYVLLTVSDTGMGMDEETVSKIFEPFFSTKGELGTGLGLATVYGIVKQHNGSIWAYSEKGLGTTFKIYLPVNEQAEVEEKKEKKTKSLPKGTEAVLLVEDNDAVRSTVGDILRDNGYRVTEAADGTSALKAVSQEGDFDLLLTDVVMPDMNGKELYEQLNPHYPSMKVLYMSGYMDDIIAHHGVLDEGVQFIQKPFNSQIILQKIRDVLSE